VNYPIPASSSANLALLGLVAVLVCSAPAAAHDAVVRCHTTALSGHLGFIQGAADSRFGPLVLTNRSHNVCTLEGYIGGQLYSAAGGRLPTRIVRDRSRPVTAVTLRPGRRAFADLHWTAIRTGPILACPQARSFAVTPPGERTQLRLRWTAGPVCRGGRIEVRPIRK
jgi:Protein of unknown function (DUF4232)